MTTLDDRLTAAIAAQAGGQVASLLRGVPENARRASNKPVQNRIKSLWDFTGEHSALAIAALGLAQSAPQAAEAVRRVDLSLLFNPCFLGRPVLLVFAGRGVVT